MSLLGRNEAEGSRGLRRLQRRLREASEKMRLYLDPDQVVEAALEAIQAELRPERASVWLREPGGAPRIARSVPHDEADANGAPPPAAVSECISRGRVASNPLIGTLTVPVVAPQTGLIAVIHVEGVGESADHQMFVEGVAREAGFALETAHLYEAAVAEKEKSEAILARVGDGVVVTDASGEISQWNDAAERIAACPSHNAIGRHCHHVLGLSVDGGELDCSNGCPLLARAEEHGTPALDVEVWRWRNDGRRQPLLANVEALRSVEGVVIGVVHSLRDITKLKEADEAKTMFLATASHELKTPLTVIKGFAEALLKRPDWEDAERTRALEAMRARAIELDRVVNRMLLSSRIESGRSRVEVTEVDVPGILCERVLALGESTGRELVTEFDASLPEAVADPEALTTVVDHLLDNATKYSPDGGRIAVTAVADDSRIRIAVADEGIGMDAEQTANCFQKFWQAESSDVRRFGGTGIGLYIVESLVRAMGGDVSVESVQDEGSTFTVSLKRAGVEEPEPQPEPEPEPEGDKLGPVRPEPSIVREFMRQIGVPDRSER